MALRDIAAAITAIPARRANGRRLFTGIVAVVLCAAGAAEMTMAQGDATSAPDAASQAGTVAFGRLLFNSPLLSRDGTVSCATCHIEAFGFSGDRPLAVGVAGFVSDRRAPSLLDLSEAKHLMWDGRAPDLRSQAALPLESPEMAVRWPETLARLRDDPVVADAIRRTGLAVIDRDTVLDALAAFVGSLQSGASRFDRYFHGRDNTALTEQELLGLRLFTHKAHCSNCHLLNGLETTFTDGAFHAMGIGCQAAACADAGRAAITGVSADRGAFKTPALRAVALRPYLMHDGSITSLKAAVERYNLGVETDAPDRLPPLHLTSDEIDAIVSFLGALTPAEFENQGRRNSFDQHGDAKQ
jgi:cytochrome c peroxidase